MRIVILNFLSKLGFSMCWWCGKPVLKATIHKRCVVQDQLAWSEEMAREAAEDAAFYAQIEAEYQLAEEAHRLEADKHHLDELMDSFCIVPGCYEIRSFSHVVGDHFEYCNECEQLKSQCICRTDDDDICQGICGQPAHACTCAETEALRRHNADPETRGSWFVV